MPIGEINSATLHRAILQHLVDHGFAPSRLALAQRFGVDADAEVVAGALHMLQGMHGVVLHPHVPEVWIAHPFSTAPTPFTVRHDTRVWWGNCAWCSLGVAALLGGNDVKIQTTLGAEGQPVTIHVDNGRVREELWVHFPIPMTHAWDNVVYTCSTSQASGTPGTWTPTGKSGLLMKLVRYSLDSDLLDPCGHYLSPSTVSEIGWSPSGRIAGPTDGWFPKREASPISAANSIRQ
ncbi:MAG: organomercurial lyase [Gammaproteobacteria bacterium]